jgi:hypothetical protein
MHPQRQAFQEQRLDIQYSRSAILKEERFIIHCGEELEEASGGVTTTSGALELGPPSE